MLAHSLLVESVALRRHGGSAGGNDVLSDRFDRCPEAPGEKKLGPFAPKRACDGAADRASGSVDHRDLVLEQHHHFSYFGARWLQEDDPATQEDAGRANAAIVDLVCLNANHVTLMHSSFCSL